MYSKIWEIVPSQGKALAILFLSFLVRTWLFFRIFLGQCGSAMLHRSGSFGVEAADTVRTILFVLFFAFLGGGRGYRPYHLFGWGRGGGGCGCRPYRPP